jgi:hypothetical protein
MKGSAALTTKIEIRDKDGRKIGEKEVATYQGLLARAHDEGLRSVKTEIVQFPTKDNGQSAIVRAEVRTNEGTFAAIGDASPSNVNRRIAPHFIRMAETRAKARALRDAVNIGMVSIEELGDLSEEDASPEESASAAPTAVMNRRPAPGNGTSHGPQSAPAESASNGHELPGMSDAQRRLLFRLASDHGHPPEGIEGWLKAELDVADLAKATRSQASGLIDRLKGDGGTPSRRNGASA